ncbi:MAG: hypothetical protein Q7J48_14240, partial [Nocardioides sp.]|nr:hypothetical protein [Nocardioides sp.]
MSDQRTSGPNLSGPDLSGPNFSGIAPPPSLDDILSADHDDTRIGAVDFTTLRVPVDDDTAEPAPEPEAVAVEPEPEPEPEPVPVPAIEPTAEAVVAAPVRKAV